MYSRKSVRQRMEPQGTPTLTEGSCEDFPSRTTRICLFLRKEEIRPNIRPEILSDLNLWRNPVCQTLSKPLDISSTTAQVVASDLLKTLAILSVTTVRRSAVDREDLKPYRKSEKGLISLDDWQSYYLQVFLRLLLTTERRLTGWWFLAVDLFPTFLNTGTNHETFQQSAKKRLLQALKCIMRLQLCRWLFQL